MAKTPFDISLDELSDAAATAALEADREARAAGIIPAAEPVPLWARPILESLRGD
jgi:hypothetical protein